MFCIQLETPLIFNLLSSISIYSTLKKSIAEIENMIIVPSAIFILLWQCECEFFKYVSHFNFLFGTIFFMFIGYQSETAVS